MKQDKKKVAVVLSGCGVFDGTEIHEAVLTLLAVEEEEATWHCFAPKMEQLHVINHVTGEIVDGEKRDVFTESARIARGSEKLSDLAEFDPSEFDCLLFPGGFGGAKNLSDFAIKSTDSHVVDCVQLAVRSTYALKKPIGFICITPASVGALTLGGDRVILTIGNDHETASAVESLGAKHHECSVEDIVVDFDNKIVSTPAYMLGLNIKGVRIGISKLVKQVISMC